jgi:hypothetical protein
MTIENLKKMLTMCGEVSAMIDQLVAETAPLRAGQKEAARRAFQRYRRSFNDPTGHDWSEETFINVFLAELNVEAAQGEGEKCDDCAPGISDGCDGCDHNTPTAGTEEPNEGN